MLKLDATEARSRFTLIYRGYDLEVTRAPSGWFVGVCDTDSAKLPIHLLCGVTQAAPIQIT